MAGRPRRIVVYVDAVARGGAEVSLRNLLRVLDPALAVTVMGVDADTCSWIASARPGTDVALVRSVPNKIAVGRLIGLRRQIARLRPDVFHANLRMNADAQYVLAAALTVPGVKVIAVEHSPLPPSTRLSTWLKRATAARLAAHVTVGDRVARLIEHSVGLPPGSIRTIHNGVPDLGPAPARLTGPRTVIGTIARHDRLKGLDVLLRAAAGLPDVDVLLAGEGPEGDALAAQAASLGLNGRVTFLPWSDSPRDLLAKIDVFVLPSRLEGFPLSILEAMLAARPVVATDVGSVREAVEDGRTGFVIAVDDVEALRGALERLAGDPELCRRMGEAGRARVLERFSVEAMGRAFERLYARL